MKSSEYLKTLNGMDLKALYTELKKQNIDLQKSRFQAKFRNLKDNSKIYKIRKNIARIYTVIRVKLEKSNK